MASLLIALYPDLLLGDPDNVDNEKTTSLMPLNLMIGTNNTYASMLCCNPRDKFVNQRNVGTSWFKYDVTAASMSALSLLIIAIIILSDKRV